MKTKILTLTVISLMLGFTMQAAKDGKDSAEVNNKQSQKTFQACINEYHDNIIEFRVDKATEDIVRIFIYNEQGERVYHRKLKRKNLVAIDCDVNNLPQGTYDFVVERNGVEYLKKSIMVSGNI